MGGCFFGRCGPRPGPLHSTFYSPNLPVWRLIAAIALADPPHMKIILLGPDGQVGWELRRALAPLGEVIALMRERRGLDGVRLLRSGPGKLSQALGITRLHNALALDAPPFALIAPARPARALSANRSAKAGTASGLLS